MTLLIPIDDRLRRLGAVTKNGRRDVDDAERYGEIQTCDCFTIWIMLDNLAPEGSRIPIFSLRA